MKLPKWCPRSWAQVKTDLLYAKKAVAVATVLESGAVALGLLDNAQAGVVTAVLGAVTTGLVFGLKNIPKD